MTKKTQYDPNKPGSKGGTIYGLPFSPEESDLVIIPVPWDVTASYRPGSRFGPQAILDASLQVDLYDALNPGGWKRGIYLEPIDQELLSLASRLRERVEPYLSLLAEGGQAQNPAMQHLVNEVNRHSDELNIRIRMKTSELLKKGKKVAIVGGDHSTPLGFLQALAQIHSDFGILQIDAHADLRKAYEDFQYSHASIMWNALQISEVKKLIQVGVRDYCDEELAVIKNEHGRVQTFFDNELHTARYMGRSWNEQCALIVAQLPKKVYVSFDIDGLDPSLCPNTGTPVPGGLQFSEAVHLIHAVVASGRELVGFDLNEVSPDAGNGDWDANVGARLLYKLSNLLLLSA